MKKAQKSSSNNNRKPKKQRLKAQRKFSKAAKKGKLSRHVKERVKAVQDKRMAKRHDQFAQVQQDWLIDRRVRAREADRFLDDSSDDGEEDGPVPLDMLDPDQYPQDSAFFGKSKKSKKKNNEEDDDDEMDPEEWAEQMRTFVDEEELLPLKVDGKLVRRMKMAREGQAAADGVEVKEETMEEEEEDQATGNAGNGSQLQAWQKEEDQQEPMMMVQDEQQLQATFTKFLAQAESTVAAAVDAIIVDPRENVAKFRPLLQMAAGKELSPLIREQVQKLVTASLAELFVNIVPGYTIHALTEAERAQKMRKETKRLAAFEESLLGYYVKYLKLLEKNATRCIGRRPDESKFWAQFGILCAKCLCRLADSCTHFNYAPNIISCLVRLSMSKWDKLLDECCACLARVFATDLHLHITLHGVKAISTLVDKKKSAVPPKLLHTLLSVNIKEVERKDESTAAKNRKKDVPPARRRKRKYDKQIDKLEVELREAVAADAHTAKLRLGTEVTRHLFITFFRVLRRMPQSPLIRPVLKGIVKYVHLINVEFYDDLVANLERLIELKKAKFRVALPLNYSIDHLQRLVGEVAFLYGEDSPFPWTIAPVAGNNKNVHSQNDMATKFKFLVPI